MKAAFEQLEQTSGAVQTYVVAATTVGIGAWIGENWFLILSAIAVLVRLSIDIPKAIDYWKNRNGKADSK